MGVLCVVGVVVFCSVVEDAASVILSVVTVLASVVEDVDSAVVSIATVLVADDSVTSSVDVLNVVFSDPSIK
jgi:hypothetical protein